MLDSRAVSYLFYSDTVLTSPSFIQRRITDEAIGNVGNRTEKRGFKTWQKHIDLTQLQNNQSKDYLKNSFESSEAEHVNGM